MTTAASTRLAVKSFFSSGLLSTRVGRTVSADAARPASSVLTATFWPRLQLDKIRRQRERTCGKSFPKEAGTLSTFSTFSISALNIGGRGAGGELGQVGGSGGSSRSIAAYQRKWCISSPRSATRWVASSIASVSEAELTCVSRMALGSALKLFKAPAAASTIAASMPSVLSAPSSASRVASSSSAPASSTCLAALSSRSRFCTPTTA
mmetsp:Transcript_44450/g.110589  ORF Transcript_44450/g.110589 Transcript_44450/m.110589 type:complete len:208 (+) Transcript_44450:1176-1799(+)